MVPRARADGLTAERIRLWGVVQGIGLRPAVARLARSRHLRGTVRNRGGLVEIIALGSEARRDGFWQALQDGLPAPARVIRQQREPLHPMHRARLCGALPNSISHRHQLKPHQKRQTPAFRILASDPLPGLVFPAPDLPMCSDCLTDMDDPGNRRYRHALVSCMACGPRFSILRGLPYDRVRTSLDAFPLCPRCRHEYGSLSDRRYHAQTISCLDCGPQIHWCAAGFSVQSAAQSPGPAAAVALDGESALAAAVGAIRQGGVVAVKGIGGYHLACDPACETAVARVREIKKREHKPFAVMYPDIESVARDAVVTAAEARALLSDPRPIVLVHRHPAPPVGTAGSARLAPGVCGRSAQVGAFLPCAPLQVLLTRACGPLVMTSANASDEPIIFRDEDMLAFAGVRPGLAGILAHDRPILHGLDDSVVRLAGERPILIRRSRGHVPLAIDIGQPPEPVPVPPPAPNESAQAPVAPAPELPMPVQDPVILATGADLKATFAIVSQGFAWLSAPVGDLESQPVHARWLDEQLEFRQLLQLTPDLVVIDLHPGYISGQTTARRSAYQHHEAHIASVMAEHRLAGPALGLAFDGTGYGHGGMVWGGEGLLFDAAGCRRLGGLRPTPLPGGDAGMRDAWRSLLGYLTAAGIGPETMDGLFSGVPEEAVAMLAAACRGGFGCLPNSSVGRLFDAVCCLLGLSDRNHYEGECGSLLEDCARAAADAGEEAWPLALPIIRDGACGLLQADPDPLFRELLTARRGGIAPERLALGFHDALVTASRALLNRWADETGVRKVALSGGVFQNAFFSARIDRALRADGFAVYWNEQVPPNDGGICLGQAWLARRDRGRPPRQ